jgi:hypothetical protein
MIYLPDVAVHVQHPVAAIVIVGADGAEPSEYVLRTERMNEAEFTHEVDGVAHALLAVFRQNEVSECRRDAKKGEPRAVRAPNRVVDGPLFDRARRLTLPPPIAFDPAPVNG